MKRLLASAVVVVVVMCGPSARAACTAPLSERTVSIETSATTDAVTNHANWQEQALTIDSRDGDRRSFYGRVASDQRFGSTDRSYDAGAFSPLGLHLIGNLEGSFSPTHAILPATTESGGLDWRTGGGYGYQAQYTQRNYTAQNAGIVSLAADHYVGVDRFAIGVTLAGVTAVPGIALTTHGTFARYFTCDEETFTVSGGRDVELTGAPGRVAVYKALSFDSNVVHWFTRNWGVSVGAGWDILTGAYDRFEVRVGLRERS